MPSLLQQGVFDCGSLRRPIPFKMWYEPDGSWSLLSRVKISSGEADWWAKSRGSFASPFLSCLWLSCRPGMYSLVSAKAGRQLPRHRVWKKTSKWSTDQSDPVDDFHQWHFHCANMVLQTPNDAIRSLISSQASPSATDPHTRIHYCVNMNNFFSSHGNAYVYLGRNIIVVSSCWLLYLTCGDSSRGYPRRSSCTGLVAMVCLVNMLHTLSHRSLHQHSNWSYPKCHLKVSDLRSIFCIIPTKATNSTEALE